GGAPAPGARRRIGPGARARPPRRLRDVARKPQTPALVRRRHGHRRAGRRGARGPGGGERPGVLSLGGRRHPGRAVRHRRAPGPALRPLRPQASRDVPAGRGAAERRDPDDRRRGAARRRRLRRDRGGVVSHVNGLRCRECGAEYETAPRSICEDCFGPLEVAYDYERVGRTFGRDALAGRTRSMWRYRELLPIDGDRILGQVVGFTPLLNAVRISGRLGVDELYLKNDAVNFPTLSFKDRVVSVALTKAREFGMTTVGCASTGNLANAVAAQG